MTIADILRHEGGMPAFSQQINIEDCYPENINNNNVGKIIENEELKNPQGEYRHVNMMRERVTHYLWQTGVPRPHPGHDPAGGVQEGGA